MIALFAMALVGAKQQVPAGAQLPVVTPSKRICRRTAAIGSRVVAKPVCRTAAEWAALSKGSSAQKDEAERVLDNLPRTQYPSIP